VTILILPRLEIYGVYAPTFKDVFPPNFFLSFSVLVGCYPRLLLDILGGGGAVRSSKTSVNFCRAAGITYQKMAGAANNLSCTARHGCGRTPTARLCTGDTAPNHEIAKTTERANRTVAADIRTQHGATNSECAKTE
jgi:hypothetical protein